MIPRSIFHRLLHLGTSNNTVSSQLNVFLQKYSCWKEFKQFHTSSVKYSNQESNEKKDEKSPPVGIWLNMTLKEVATVLKTNTDIIMSLLPASQNLDHGPSSIIERHNIIQVAKRLNKKCIVVKDPKLLKPKETKVSTDYQPPPKPENLVKRPPVVTVMGHVDHGKTTLLDSLRNTSVVASEFGGITQHIGAFSVEVKPGERITFIDTPGHAAFTAMRARGAQVTDIVVLVVAADDGVMNQTVESIRIAKRAGVHIIVALNKIDKPSALSADEIKERLLLEGIQVEDRGGDVQMVSISALKKINLDLLTEQILLEAEIMNLTGDPTGLIEGVIIESKVDINKGIVATVIVKRGTLKRGKVLVAGKAFGKVRAMLDENGNQFNEALPSTPVQILGWKEIPSAGDEVIEAKTEKQARSITKRKEQEEMMAKNDAQRPIIEKKAAMDKATLKKNREYLKSLDFRERKQVWGEMMKKKADEEGDETVVKINLIIKGDVHGSVDALLDILDTYDKDEECQLSVIDASVGDITQKDIELAELFDAIIYGFNVAVHRNAKSLADEKKADIRYFNVIYKLLDDLIAELNSTLPPKDVEEIIGEARVNENFLISVKQKKVPVAGCTCLSGELKKDSSFKVIRGEDVIYNGKASSLKHHKTEVSSIQKNVDCGLMLDSFDGRFIEGDRVVCYEMVKVPQTTSWKPSQCLPKDS